MTQQPCRCGRRWIAEWSSRHAYRPTCPGCGETPGNCTCEPLDKPECRKYNVKVSDVDAKLCSDNCGTCGHLKTFT